MKIKVAIAGVGNCASALVQGVEYYKNANESSCARVVRATKPALDRCVKGPLTSISAYAFKHPPVQVPDHIGRQWVEEFIQRKCER